MGNVIWLFSALGQAKLIAGFLFQDFQNIMQAGGHYSLIIIYNM